VVESDLNAVRMLRVGRLVIKQTPDHLGVHSLKPSGNLSLAASEVIPKKGHAEQIFR
jgi:hypothetical protein